MSVCRHHPGGITEFIWQIDDYDQRLKTAINGDEWTSEIFTANLPGQPKFSLIFFPPIPFTVYSENYPYMATSSSPNQTILFLALNELVQIDITYIMWMENENGDIISEKLGYGKKYNTYVWFDPLLPSTTKRFSIYCQITGRGAMASKTNEEEKVVDLLSVQSMAPEYMFVLDISNGLENRQEYEINDKKFTFQYDKNTTTFEWHFKALSEKSCEYYLCEMWLENELGHRSFISRRHYQPFRYKIFRVWRGSLLGYFGLQRLSRFCMKIRPYNSCLYNQIRHFHTVNFNSSQFGDVKVVANDGGVFYMPKVVLYLHSDKFKDQVDLDSKTLETILWLMCTGKVKNKKMANSELHAIAGRYQLDEIQELIVEIMLENLCVESAVDALKLAFEYDHMAEFKEKTIKFALNNFDEIAKSNEWKQLAVSHVEIVTHLISASYHSSKL
ncbi:hypothetical protein M3Y95_01199600 [Aphelenchoides besseyi]|nr:hypothetical protein M3Y95_01199600 [Aphelenchoides besseyi]